MDAVDLVDVVVKHQRPGDRPLGPWCFLLAFAILSACSPAPKPAPAPVVDAGYVAAHPERWKAAPAPVANPAAAELEAIGYLPGTKTAPAREGVTLRDPRAMSGLLLYTSGHAPEATLMDETGKVLHTWKKALLEVWPDLRDRPHQPQMEYWRQAYLYPNGDLLAIFDGIGILKLDRNSKLIWATLNQAHHDLVLNPQGDMYVLTRDAHIVESLNPHAPVIEDYLSVLDANGKEKQRLSIIEALLRSPYASLLDACKGKYGDILHANAVVLFDGSAAKSRPEFTGGRVLVSIRELDALVALDPEAGKAVWAWQERFRRQHDPSITRAGTGLLLFDNRGPGTQSAVVEFALDRLQRVWSYEGTPQHPFYSESCGQARRLANGNTFIVESDAGRAFEVTPEGDTVWEFYNPHRAGPEGVYIAALFTMVRLPSDFHPDWLAP